MTVPNAAVRNSYVGNGVTTVFPFTFKVFQTSEVLVYVAGVLTGVGFTTTIDASGIGGNVTFAVPPANGLAILLISSTVRNQSTDWTANDPDPAESKERAFDRAMKIDQEQDEAISRSIRAPIFEAIDMILPTIAGRNSRVLGFDTNGLPTAVPLPGAAGGDVSLATVIATGSVTSRSLATRYAEIVNVKDYGAIGDGVADDTTTIQAAISAAVSTGNAIFFPRGIYKITATISVPSNMTLFGVKEGTIIRPSTVSQVGFTLVNSSTRTTIRDMVIDANGVANIIGISMTLTDHINVNSVIFKGVTKTIYGDRASTLNIENCRSESIPGGHSYGYLEITDSTNASHSFTSWINNYHVRTLGAFSGTPPAQAILLHRAVNVLIRGFAGDALSSAVGNGNGIVLEDDCQGVMIANSWIAVVDRGIRLQAVAGRSPYLVTIDGVLIDQSKTSGIDYSAGSNLTVVGCAVTNTLAGAIGIYLQGARSVVSSSVIQGGGANGIFVEVGTSNFVLVNNRISDCTIVAIGISAGASNNYNIVGNDLTLGNTGALSDGGTGAVKNIYGNLGLNPPIRVGRVVVTYSASMTFDCNLGDHFYIVVTNGTAFTINAPTNAIDGLEIKATIINSSGGALGTATFNAAFKMSTWTNPANNFNRSLTWRYNGVNWVQISQTGVDVPN